MEPLFNFSLWLIGAAAVFTVVAFIADAFDSELMHQMMKAAAKVFCFISLVFWAIWLVQKLILTFS